MSVESTTSPNPTMQDAPAHRGPDPGRSSPGKPVLLVILLVIGFAALFFLGWKPRRDREREVIETSRQVNSAPTVIVAKAERAEGGGELLLPGSIQAITEAPIFARSEGYLKKRYVDIGDRVRAGQILAEIEAPELDQQVRQAQANLSRAKASLSQAEASLRQAVTQMKLAEVTAQRWNTLVARGVLSKQDGDEKQAAWDARQADTQAAQASVNAARDSVNAFQAELERLQELKSFEILRAPFTGVVTVRNTDVGALIHSGSSDGHELFRMAQIATLRIFINVPQPNVASIHTGQHAEVLVQEFPDRNFDGRVTRTANSLDANSRTLLTEVQVANADSKLLPGMYAQVRLVSARRNLPLMVPGDTIVVRRDGPQLAVVGSDNKVRFRPVELGRDYGAKVEIVSGLQGGEMLVVNPSDNVREGAEVNPVPEREPGERAGKTPPAAKTPQPAPR